MLPELVNSSKIMLKDKIPRLFDFLLFIKLHFYKKNKAENNGLNYLTMPTTYPRL